VAGRPRPFGRSGDPPERVMPAAGTGPHSGRVASCDPVSTRTFHLLSCAPAEQVWAALTCPALSGRFLHGLRVDGGWEQGSPLRFTSEQGVALSGRVLWAAPPYKLSLTIEDDGCDSCTYLTWELREGPSGTVVRLTVEEGHAGPSDDHELEDVWLPTLKALETLLQG
jgi:uncharacterized protein YndB with AHSA1/START domain